VRRRSGPAQELRRPDPVPALDLLDGFDDEGQVDADGAAAVAPEPAQAEPVAVRAVAAHPRLDGGGIGVVVPAAQVQDHVHEAGQVLVDRAGGGTDEAAGPVVRPVEADGADPPADGLPVRPVLVLGVNVGQGHTSRGIASPPDSVQ
jgi:hypothetical protein